MFSANFDRMVREVARAVEGAGDYFSRRYQPDIASGRCDFVFVPHQRAQCRFAHRATRQGRAHVESVWHRTHSHRLRAHRHGTADHDRIREQYPPLPRDKPEIAMAHALAAEYLGMQCAYLDAGSGPELMVPEDMVCAVCDYVDIPVIVGGGIRDPKAAAKTGRTRRVFVVVGSAFEETGWDAALIGAFAAAIHHLD